MHHTFVGTVAPGCKLRLEFRSSRQFRSCGIHLNSNAWRQRSVVCAAGRDSDSDKGSGGLGLGGKKYGENLEARIASGEFDDSGSTKEKLSRPLRKFLAQDAFGPGKSS